MQQETKTSRKGLGLLLHNPSRSIYVEDNKTQQISSSRPYIPQLPKMSQGSLSSTNTHRILASQDRPISIAEEQDSYKQYPSFEGELQVWYPNKKEESTRDLSVIAKQMPNIGFIDFYNWWQGFRAQPEGLDYSREIPESAQDQSARNEVELGFKMREVERKNIKFSCLQMKQLKLSDKNQSLRSTIDVHSHKTTQLVDENQKMNRQLKQENKSNSNNTKKIQALEKRIEFLLENEVNHGLNPNDKLRSSLNELLKENECIKRELQHKKQELDRVQGQLNQYIQMVNRLQKTIDNMKKKNCDDDESKTVFKKDDIDLLINFKIPSTLNFRIVSLKLNSQHLINDLIEKGPQQTMQHNFTLPLEAQKNQTLILAKEFISYKEFAEKQNQFFFQFEQFSKTSNFEDLVYMANRVLPTIFNCEQVRLWLIDGMNGSIFTYLETRQQVRALQHKGQIADVFKLRTAQNISGASQKPLLYRIQESEQADYARNALLIPIFCEGNDNAIRGILEITNTQNEFFSFDEEYFGILASHSLSHILQRLVDKQSWMISKKYRGMMVDAFNSLMTSKSQQEFTAKISHFLGSIFGFSAVVFYFVENSKLVSYGGPDVKTYDFSYGLAGMVAETKQKLIINDVKNSIHFNPTVDIKSILPIFALPILDSSGNTLAVIETVLKSKLKIQVQKDALISPSQGLLGMEEPLTKQLTAFVDMIAAAMINIKF